MRGDQSVYVGRGMVANERAGTQVPAADVCAGIACCIRSNRMPPLSVTRPSVQASWTKNA